MKTADDTADQITQTDINNCGATFVLCNYADGVNGVAMQGHCNKLIDGETESVRIHCEIRENEEQDNSDIYTTDRVLSASRM